MRAQPCVLLRKNTPYNKQSSTSKHLSMLQRALSTTAHHAWRGVLPPSSHHVQQRLCVATVVSSPCIRRLASTAPTYAPPTDQQSPIPTSYPIPNLAQHTLPPPKYARNYGPSIADSFAVVLIGGKQYKVTKGDVITTETLQADVGSHIVLDKVLLVGTKDLTAIGTPLLHKAKVAATIEEQTRLEKVYIFKKKRRKNFQKTQGHRQNVTVMRITDIFMDYQTAEQK